MANPREVRAGYAYVEIGAVDDKLKAALDRATGRLRSFAGFVAGLGTAMLGFGTAPVAGLFALAASAGTTGQMLDNLALRTGLVRDQMALLAFIGERAGVRIEDVADGIKEMSKAIGEAQFGEPAYIERFVRAGVDLQQLYGKSTFDRLLLIADALDGISDPANKAFLAEQLFSEAGSKMIPVIKGGSAAIREMAARADELGLTVGTAATGAAVGFRKLLSETQAQLAAIKNVVGSQAAQAFAPYLKAIQPVIAASIRFIANHQELVSQILIVGTTVAGVGGALLTFSVAVYGASFAMNGLALASYAITSPLRLVANGLLTATFAATGFAASMVRVIAALSVGTLLAAAGAISTIAGALASIGSGAAVGAIAAVSFAVIGLSRAAIVAATVVTSSFGAISGVVILAGGRIIGALTAILPIAASAFGRLGGIVAGAFGGAFAPVFRYITSLYTALGRAALSLGSLMTGRLIALATTSLNVIGTALAAAVGPIAAATAAAVGVAGRAVTASLVLIADTAFLASRLILSSVAVLPPAMAGVAFGVAAATRLVAVAFVRMAVASIVLSKTVLGAIAVIAPGVAAALSGIGTIIVGTFAGLLGPVSASLGALSGGVVAAASTLLASVTTVLAGGVAGMLAAVSAAASAGVALAVSAATAAATAAVAAIGTLVTAAVGLISAGFAVVITAITPMVSSALAAIVVVEAAAASAILTALYAVVPGVAAIIGGVVTSFGLIVPALAIVAALAGVAIVASLGRSLGEIPSMLGGVVARIKDSVVGSALSSIGSSVGGLISSTFTAVTGAMTRTFGPALSLLWSDVVNIARLALVSAVSIITGTGKSAAATAISTVSSLISGSVSAIVNGVTAAVGPLASAIGSVISFVGSVAADIGDAIIAGFRFMVPSFQSVASALGPIMDGISATIAAFAKKNGLDDLANAILKLFGDAGDIAAAAVSEIAAGFKGLGQAVSTAMTVAYGFVTSAIDGIVTSFGGIRETIAATFAGVASLISSAADSVRGFFTAIPDLSRQAFSRMIQLGSVAYQGLVAIFGDLKQILAGTFQGAMDALQAGNLALAGEIAFVGLQAAWERVVLAIKTIWFTAKDAIVAYAVDKYATLAERFVVMLNTLQTGWAQALTGMKAAWAIFSASFGDIFEDATAGIIDFFLRVQAKVSGLNYDDLKKQAETDREIRTKTRASDRDKALADAAGTGQADAEKLRATLAKQIAAIKASIAGIPQNTDAAARASLEATEKKLRDLEERLKGLQEKAAAERAKKDTAGKDPGADAMKKLDAAMNQTQKVIGTFSSTAIGLIGGKGDDKVANNTAATVATLNKTNAILGQILGKRVAAGAVFI